MYVCTLYVLLLCLLCVSPTYPSQRFLRTPFLLLFFTSRFSCLVKRNAPSTVFGRDRTTTTPEPELCRDWKHSNSSRRPMRRTITRIAKSFTLYQVGKPQIIWASSLAHYCFNHRHLPIYILLDTFGFIPNLDIEYQPSS